ncbi:MAG TPA: DUF523 and DUF1722 domain-containing protein [bacterium]|nr:DUF523 and DUF1722 domain-containing protein [bacterium]HPN42813.1 DUF523 and DUF1722 domain-containing protein [bacterium]
MTNKLKLGISSCLLGESVRYDGGHKLDKYLRDILGQFVEWAPVCPEVECGLSTPREAMHLIGDVDSPRLVTVKSGVDLTEQMLKWAEEKLAFLEKEELCGFIFKTKSPSSGMRDVRIYNDKGMVVNKGVGLWAKAFMKHFPWLPVEDEGRLNDAALRENFIERIFVMHRWRQLGKNQTVGGLVNFHTEYKLLLMAHSPAKLRALGKLVSNPDNLAVDELFRDYFSLLMPILQLIATPQKHVNVLQHIMGYFKKQLSADEKQELLDIINSYYNNQVPLIVPVVLLQHYTRKYNDSYLKKQIYLNPHPKELMLRNHV